MNRVYVCTDFVGHWPVGVSAVVFASDEATARDLLTAELAGRGLGDQSQQFTLRELDAASPRAVVLNDGDY